MFGDVLFGKKCHSTREKCRLITGKKIKGSKEINPWFFLSKILKKIKLFFLGILGVDKVFGDILNSTQSTLEEKNVHICEWPKN